MLQSSRWHLPLSTYILVAESKSPSRILCRCSTPVSGSYVGLRLPTSWHRNEDSTQYIADHEHAVISSSQASACSVEPGSVEDVRELVWSCFDNNDIYSCMLHSFAYWDPPERLSAWKVVGTPVTQGSLPRAGLKFLWPDSTPSSSIMPWVPSILDLALLGTKRMQYWTQLDLTLLEDAYPRSAFPVWLSAAVGETPSSWHDEDQWLWSQVILSWAISTD